MSKRTYYVTERGGKLYVSERPRLYARKVRARNRFAAARVIDPRDPRTASIFAQIVAEENAVRNSQ